MCIVIKRSLRWVIKTNYALVLSDALLLFPVTIVFWLFILIVSLSLVIFSRSERGLLSKSQLPTYEEKRCDLQDARKQTGGRARTKIRMPCSWRASNEGKAAPPDQPIRTAPSLLWQQLWGLPTTVKTFPSTRRDAETPRISKHAIFQPSSIRAKRLVETLVKTFAASLQGPPPWFSTSSSLVFYFSRVCLFLRPHLGFGESRQVKTIHCLLSRFGRLWKKESFKKTDRDGWLFRASRCFELWKVNDGWWLCEVRDLVDWDWKIREREKFNWFLFYFVSSNQIKYCDFSLLNFASGF